MQYMTIDSNRSASIVGSSGSPVTNGKVTSGERGKWWKLRRKFQKDGSHRVDFPPILETTSDISCRQSGDAKTRSRNENGGEKLGITHAYDSYSVDDLVSPIPQGQCYAEDYDSDGDSYTSDAFIEALRGDNFSAYDI